MNGAADAALLILSDTHFGDDLLAETQIPPLDYWRWLDTVRVGPRVHRFFQDNCIAHDLAVVKTLPYYIRYLFTSLRDQGFSGDDFDLYVFLGDHVTWPSSPAFRFFREYITRDEYVARATYLRQACRGLSVSPNRLILVPGNHDKMLHPDLETYHGLLSARASLPSKPDPRGCHLISKTIRGHEFLFIVVDANVYAPEREKLDGSARGHLARGEISQSLIDTVHERLELLQAIGIIDDAEVGNYSSCIKILLVHFAPDLDRLRSASGGFKERLLPHECSGLARLIKSLNTELDLVIHGHMHVASVYKCESVDVISLGSACQIGGEPSFALLKFEDSCSQISIENHVWYRRGFVLESQQTLTRSPV